MDEQAYWAKQQDKYLTTDWIDKPSIFVTWAETYFPANGSVLELGAGQAQDSRYLANKNYSVTSTDFSDHAIELAKSKSPNTITFQQLDLWNELPFKEDSFDAVYAHLSLHYLDKAATEHMFAEIKRVLKPGGILAALMNSTSDPEISEGKKIEENYIELDGIRKRYFDPEAARQFAADFEIIVADDEGTTYKDSAKGINNLIRLIAKKRS